jgi:FtsH-binding integral membrane protein
MEDTIIVDSNKTLRQTFLWMFLGLLSTGIISAYTYYTGAFIQIAGAWTGILIAQIAIAVVFGLCFHKLPTGVVTFLFFLYSILTGVTFSVIFAVFELTSVAYALLATAGFFGVLAFIGYSTKKDLSKFGTVLMAALIIALVLTLINIFVGKSTFLLPFLCACTYILAN